MFIHPLNETVYAANETADVITIMIITTFFHLNSYKNFKQEYALEHTFFFQQNLFIPQHGKLFARI